MMHRSGWGTKEGQEAILGLRIGRAFFDSLLAWSVTSSWDRDRFPSRDGWEAAVARSSVRVQRDPDHDPSGARMDRRAIRLGLRCEALEAFARKELLEVFDLTNFVAEQRRLLSEEGSGAIVTPRERIYMPRDPDVAVRLGLSPEERG